MNNPGENLYAENNVDIKTSVDKKDSEKDESLKLKEFIKAVLIALLAAVIIKSFFFEAYKIPTGSMEKTLLAGDFIIVNKAAYLLSTPSSFPLTDIDIPSVKILSFGKPERNDVIVFRFPGFKDELIPSTDVNYIKRIIGLPGDTVQIINKEVFVNHKKIPLSPSGKINMSDILEKNIIEERIFPKGKKWNRDNYGPIIIPKEGMTISVSPRNIKEWKTIIDREFDKRTVSEEGSVVTIDNKPARFYTFKKNYYFVMGDNRDDSMDSRYWGFVSEERIIGKALLVYWSWDPYANSGIKEFFASIRFSRILNSIH